MPGKISAFWLMSLVLLLVGLAILVGNAAIKLPTEADEQVDISVSDAVSIEKSLPVHQEKSVSQRIIKTSKTRFDSAGSVIEVSGDKLSVRVVNWSLQSVLSEIATQAGFKVSFEFEPANTPISIELHDVSLLEGLQQLVANYDSFFFFDVENQAISSLSAIWVYPKGHGKEIAAAHAKRMAAGQKLSQTTSDDNVDNRAYGFEQLITRHPANALEIVSKSLNDSDAQVRLRTLNMAVSKGVALPVNLLGDVIAGDASAEVRAFALTALTIASDLDETQVLAIAESASHDADPWVVSKAQEIIDQAEIKASDAGKAVLAAP